MMSRQLSKQLLYTICSFYFVLAILVTCLHLYIEFHNTKTVIEQKLVVIADTFTPSLRQSLWDLNTEQTRSAFFGMIDFPEVVGLELLSVDGKQRETTGITIGDGQYAESGFNEYKDESEFGLFSYTFNIMHNDSGEEIRIGQGTIYSSNQLVIQALQDKLSLIVMMALLKTLGLFILFLWFSRKMVDIPLTKFVSSIKKRETVNLGINHPNEMMLLQDTFNDLQNQQEKYQEYLERTVEERTHDLVQSQEERKRLIAAASHELRSPLLTIALQLKTLSVANEDDREEILEDVREEIKYCQKLINDFHELSKFDLFENTLNKVDFDLNELLQQCKNAHKSNLTIKNHTLSIATPSDFSIYADPQRIRQVFDNLIDNAHKYCVDGTIIKISAHRANDMIEITYEDNGGGVDHEDLPRLFDRYFHRNKHANIKSGGLGLALVKEIIENHSGKITTYHAKDGLGFKIELPAQR